MPALPSFQLYNIELIEGKIVKRRLFTLSSAAYYITYTQKNTGSWTHWYLFDPQVTNHKQEQKIMENFSLSLIFNLKVILNISARNVNCMLSRNIDNLSGCLKMWN